jgi:hypothetical protein
VQACTPPEGHVEVGDDCDDRDASVLPGAQDYCNGIDDDCDGAIDPDVTTWYADADDDSFGTVELTFEACTPPPGFVAIAGDCDDGDDAVFPGAGPETCDGRDEDCDGLVDENALGDVTWYPDDDDDGFGAENGLPHCVVPPGWIAISGDCDDDNALVNPNRNETCNPVDVDDDCDDKVDDEDPSVVDQVAWYTDADGDGAGVGAPELSCDEIAGRVDNTDDCDDADPQAFVGGTEVCGGGDEDCDGLAEELDPGIDPESLADGWIDADGDTLGDPLAPAAVCTLGDGVVGNALDCDDADPAIGLDLWVPDEDGDGAGSGTAVDGVACVGPPDHVNVAAPADCADDDASRFPGAPDPCGDGVDGDCTGFDPVCSPELAGFLALEDNSRGFVEGAIAGGGTGMVAALGDLDLDGFADLAAGAPAENLVRVLFGPGPESAAPWPVAHEIAGAFAGDSFGVSLAGVASDWGGPGRLLVGAPNHGVGGAAFVIDDPFTAIDPLLAVTIVTGIALGDRTGESVAAVGDVDGDGVQWIVVGSPGYLNGGAFSISTASGGSHDLLAAPALITGPGGGDLGSPLAAGHDLDGDGILDIAAAAPLRTGNNGSVYVVPGDVAGNQIVTLVANAELQGASAGKLGSAVAIGDDLSGDGLPDLAASAPLDDAAAADAGAAYVFAAPSGTVSAADTAIFTVEGTAGLMLGQSLALTDLDGDGLVDLLATATSADVAGHDGGAVYAFLAPGEGTVSTLDADLVLFGTAGVGAGFTLAVGSIDGDPTPDLIVGTPDTSAGTLWLVPGAP